MLIAPHHNLVLDVPVESAYNAIHRVDYFLAVVMHHGHVNETNDSLHDCVVVHWYSFRVPAVGVAKCRITSESGSDGEFSHRERDTEG